MLLLDASKAFARIEYASLFNNLSSRNMCHDDLRSTMSMYILQKIQARFSNALSNQFTVGNGVKQGGVLSPILFTVYIDNLITILKQGMLDVKLETSFCSIWLRK